MAKIKCVVASGKTFNAVKPDGTRVQVEPGSIVEVSEGTLANMPDVLTLHVETAPKVAQPASKPAPKAVQPAPKSAA